MAKPIGFDVENIKKVAKNLPTQQNADDKRNFANLVEHIWRLSGDVLTMKASVRHILESQSTAQQEKILADFQRTMERVDTALEQTQDGKKLQDECRKSAKSVIDILKNQIKI